MKERLELFDEYISRNSLDRKSYTSNYYIYMLPLPDGNLLIVYTKGSPMKIWLHLYRKYYGGVGNPLLGILQTLGNQELFTYYASKYLKPNDDYTIENFCHLHLGRLAVNNKGMVYFYFNKPQVEDIKKFLGGYLPLLETKVDKIFSVIFKNATKDAQEIIIKPPVKKLKPKKK